MTGASGYLHYIAGNGSIAKSGLMLGLGETEEEIGEDDQGYFRNRM